ncbi:MAG: beta-lactamase family protein [Sedimentisphaerales bacterium]|nr:beta-lactamase family protein [Sedimentisphaerales bacterium]
MKTKLLLSIIVIHILIIFSYGSNPPLEDRMQKILDKGISKYGARGVSAAVIFPDGNVWTGVSGISYDTVAIEPDMLFAIGSVTKNFVATLTLKLAEEQILSLDDRLSKWLPEYPHIDSNITIRQLLNHTSGIYMFWDNQKIWEDLMKDRTKFWSPEEVLSYIKEPEFPAGEGWRYSNTNYLLLAMIIEKATDSTLSAEFKKRFWEPLGIDNAYLSQQEDIPDNQAHIYEESDLTFQPRASHESITFGSSGIFTTAESLARWSHALFEGEILQQRSMDEMLQFVEFREVSNMRAYGLGVSLYPRSFSSGKQAIGHSGGNIGTTTYMVYLPEHNVSIVVMINAFPNKSADYITKKLIRAVLRDLNAIGFIPYFDFFPTGLGLISITVAVIINILLHIRKKKRRQHSVT